MSEIIAYIDSLINQKGVSSKLNSYKQHLSSLRTRLIKNKKLTKKMEQTLSWIENATKNKEQL